LGKTPTPKSPIPNPQSPFSSLKYIYYFYKKINIEFY